jgi:DNA-binding FrmR family transcriptional regulator
MTTMQEIKKPLIHRVNRLEGQVRGLRRMLDEDRPCVEVLRQVAAVTGATKGLWRQIVEVRLRACLLDRGDAAEQEAALEAVLKAMAEF